MFGRHPAKLSAVQPVDIHGALFWDLAFALDASPDRAQTVRIGRESVYNSPQPGDLVTLHLLMGVATRVERREE